MTEFKQYQRALENINDWYTASGDEVRPELESFFELYRHRFVGVLEECNIHSEHDFSKALSEASIYECVGDFLAEESAQYALLASFGLVLFDRINSQWDHLSKSDLFYLHEQMVECLELSSKKTSRKEEARIRAIKGHAKRLEARDFVCTEWNKYSSHYGGNKSAFARDYARRVSNEFQVTVTEKQLREVWLGYALEIDVSSINDKLI